MTASFILGLYEHNKFCFDRRKLHCHFKGNTTVQSYKPTDEEKKMMQQAIDYADAVSPNAHYLNNAAKDMLQSTMGDTKQQYDALSKAALNQIGTATNGIRNTIGGNVKITDATNKTLDSFMPQYRDAVKTVNNTLGSLSPRYESEATATNNALNALSPKYGRAATATNNFLGRTGSQYGTLADSTNNALRGLDPQYRNAASSANGVLASLATGVVPLAYQQNMENSIRSALTNTMGNTINSLGQRGVLNSSVTNSAMNDISRNAADTVAQQYQQNINQVGNLTQQQLGNTNTSLEALGGLAQQRLGNSNTALGAQSELAQQQLGNTNTALGAQGEIAQQKLGNMNTALGAQGELAQQQYGNTAAGLEARTNLAQQRYGNQMGTNQLNASLQGSLIDSATAPLTATAAAQEAYQQPALNLWNASLGLNSGGTLGALAGVSGKGTTTMRQDSGGGLFGSNGLGGILGGLASGWASTWCFAADTLIKMADGTAKYIQDVVKGDKVLCPHVDGTESEEEVLDVMEPHFADVYAVTAKGKDDDFHVVLTTSTQPLLCEDGKFVTVGNMKLCKILRGGLEVISIEYDEFCKVYDLKVSGENNYYADGFVAKGGTTEW